MWHMSPGLDMQHRNPVQQLITASFDRKIMLEVDRYLSNVLLKNLSLLLIKVRYARSSF